MINPFRELLESNGWKYVDDEQYTDAAIYTADIYSGSPAYQFTVAAHVSENVQHRDAWGDFGIVFIRLFKSEDVSFDMGCDELAYAMTSLINAENNLVKLGIPFTKDYNFHPGKYPDESFIRPYYKFSVEDKQRMNVESRNNCGFVADETD